ncbi:Gpi16 subunit, GPI transamidase component [Dentipellis sp. KUC8613]|nr:Gpi16 subunit, GPI transamidase component [Dentipellis sp. KUC8613]
MWARGITALVCALLVSPTSGRHEEYDEDLVLRPLPDGKLLARFAFTTLLAGAVPRAPASLEDEDISQHYTVFPLALGQILRQYAVTELHMSLNAGKWNYDRWGYPEEPGVGTGAELWAWMGDGASSSIDERWQGTQNALAGLFCASLGAMDNQRTTSPTRAFPPAGQLPRLPTPYRHALRHATLPAEHVCTENLTPFLKLLPCPARAGAAALLDPHRVFDADWHGLGMHVRWRAGVGIELALTVQAVFDPVRAAYDGKRDWSLRSLFNRDIPRACPVAATSQVRVNHPPADSGFELSPEPSRVEDGQAIFDITNTTQDLDVAMKWPQEPKFAYPLDLRDNPQIPFSFLRTLKGASQDQGTLALTVRNHDATLPLELLYLETMPWHVEFYLHTMRSTCDGVPCDALSNLTYTPPVPHTSPALLQALLTIPPHSTLRLTFEARKAFLRYTEHPPDAQRGWDLPPAVLIPLSPPHALQSPLQPQSAGGKAEIERGWGGRRRVYTPVLLVDLATPDFSMPYNVIIMSCTLVALVFGSIFNILTRRFALVKVVEDSGSEKEEKEKAVDVDAGVQ